MLVIEQYNSVVPVLFIMFAVGKAFTVAVTAVLTETHPVTVLESNT